MEWLLLIKQIIIAICYKYDTLADLAARQETNHQEQELLPLDDLLDCSLTDAFLK